MFSKWPQWKISTEHDYINRDWATSRRCSVIVSHWLSKPISYSCILKHSFSQFFNQPNSFSDDPLRNTSQPFLIRTIWIQIIDNFEVLFGAIGLINALKLVSCCGLSRTGPQLVSVCGQIVCVTHNGFFSSSTAMYSSFCLNKPQRTLNGHKRMLTILPLHCVYRPHLHASTYFR